MELEVRSELMPVDDHDRLIDASPGPHGELVTLWTKGEGSAPGSARVIEYAPEIRRVVAIRELWTAFPTAQFLSDDEVLVVGARCEWRPAPEGPEHNAVVFDPNGRPVRTGVLGDGIEHVQVTSEGRIWVGYFDEGVFGNRGWSEPIGRPGLICFDDGFRPIRALDELGIADCYALNVGGSGWRSRSAMPETTPSPAAGWSTGGSGWRTGDR